jgi:hypothetical protein
MLKGAVMAYFKIWSSYLFGNNEGSHEKTEYPSGIQTVSVCEIPGSHGCEYEDNSLLGYCSIQSCRSRPLKHWCTSMKIHAQYPTRLSSSLLLFGWVRLLNAELRCSKVNITSWAYTFVLFSKSLTSKSFPSLRWWRDDSQS